MSAFRVPLGVMAKDRLSGFEGRVTARIQYLTGCNRIGLTPQGIKDGKPFEGSFFDEPYVEVTDSSVVQPVTPRGSDDGGPMDAPSSRSDPSAR